MKYIFSFLVLAFIYTNGFSQNYDLRNVKWGMGHEKVLKIEKQQGNEMQYYENIPYSAFLSCTDCFKIGDHSTRLTYKFTPISDKLFEASIEILYTHITEEKEAFEFVYSLLQEKFDGPGTKHFRGDLLPDGTNAENVFYLWENETTYIVFEHPYIGFKNFIIRYTSKQYFDLAGEETAKLLAKEDQQKNKEDLKKSKEKQALDEL